MKRVSFLFLLPIFAYGLNLQELVDLSIKNKLVESSVSSLDAVKKEYESVRSDYLPKLDVAAGITRITDGDGVQTIPEKSYNTSVSLNYLAYDGGKKYDIYNSYKSSIKSAEQNLESLKNQIALQVINYYFNYLTYIASEEAKYKEIEQLQSQYQRLISFYEVGNVTKDEIDKIVSSVEMANIQLREIELNIQTILHNLEYTVGQKVTIDEGATIIDVQNLGKKDLRYDIKALEFNLETSKSYADMEKSGYLPTLKFDSTVSHAKSYFENSAFDTSITQNIFSANLTWNIFSFGQTKQKYESKFKEYLSLKSNYEYEKNKADIDLRLSSKGYDISVMKLESAKLALKAADSAYEVVKSQYENGLVDNVAFLESLSDKFNAISEIEKAKNDIEIKKAEIIYNSGKDLAGYIE